MNTLLLFFALPVATIIFSIVLLKLLKCPILVAATFFAIYLILAFTVFDTDFLIFVIAYTILSYITAVITRLICNIIERVNRCLNNSREGNNQNCYCCLNNNDDNNNNSSNNNNNNNTSNNNSNQARFTLTTNQANPVLFLTNRNNNTSRRNGCCCRRR